MIDLLFIYLIVQIISILEIMAYNYQRCISSYKKKTKHEHDLITWPNLVSIIHKNQYAKRVKKSIKGKPPYLLCLITNAIFVSPNLCWKLQSLDCILICLLTMDGNKWKRSDWKVYLFRLNKCNSDMSFYLEPKY